MTYFRRARDLFCRLPVRSNTRTTASRTRQQAIGGHEALERVRVLGRRRQAAADANLEAAFGRFDTRARWPTSLMAPCAQSSRAAAESAILNLRGSAWQIGLRRKWRVTASAVRRDVEGAPSHTPASAQAVTLRTVLPHASRVVSPTSSSLRHGLGDARELHEVELHVLPRGHVAEAARVFVGDVGERARACAPSSTPCGILTRSMLTSCCRWP